MGIPTWRANENFAIVDSSDGAPFARCFLSSPSGINQFIEACIRIWTEASKTIKTRVIIIRGECREAALDEPYHTLIPEPRLVNALRDTYGIQPIFFDQMMLNKERHVWQLTRGGDCTGFYELAWKTEYPPMKLQTSSLLDSRFWRSRKRPRSKNSVHDEAQNSRS